MRGVGRVGAGARDRGHAAVQQELIVLPGNDAADHNVLGTQRPSAFNELRRQRLVAGGERGGFAAPQQRYAIALGCGVSRADDFVYADGLSLAGRAVFQPTGVSCRICKRPNYGQRAVPPLKRRLRVDPDMRAALPYAITSGTESAPEEARTGDQRRW